MLFLRSAIPLFRLDYTMECTHKFVCATLQYMELDSFVSLVLQYLIVVLSDVIEYHCPFYTVIYEACHLRKNSRKVF